MSDLQPQFLRALRLRDEGRLEDAQVLLEELVGMEPRSASVMAVLAKLYWDQGLLQDAMRLFRQATEVSPRSEVASLGLFHTLFESGEESDAFAEIRRFFSIGDSSEYRRLIREWHDELKLSSRRQPTDESTDERDLSDFRRLIQEWTDELDS